MTVPFNDAQVRWLLSTIQEHPPAIDGVDGPQGPQGPTGAQGPQGEVNVVGVTGPQGPQGVAGERGAVGRDGTNGDDGEPGEEGPQGFQGPQGERGSQGPKGAKGDEGPQGPAGKNGSPGGAGMMGVQGATGPQGPAGPSGGGAGALQTVTVDLTTDDIATLNSVPVEIVAAQGAGTFIVPVGASFQFKVATSSFASTGGNLALGFAAAGLAIMISDTAFNDADSLVRTFTTLAALNPSDVFGALQAEVENLPLVFSCGSDPGIVGSILTSHIDDGDNGIGYVIGDEITLEIVVEGAEPAVIVVDTVGDDGEVLTYHVTDPGNGYGPEDFVAQDTTTGAGEGFQLAIDTITPLTDGTARITVVYYVMTLL